MVPDDEDSRDFDDATDSSLQPVTDLAGVGDEPSNDVEGLSSQTTTDISSVLEQDSSGNQVNRLFQYYNNNAHILTGQSNNFSESCQLFL